MRTLICKLKNLLSTRFALNFTYFTVDAKKREDENKAAGCRTVE